MGSLISGVGTYNRSVELDEGVDNAWSQVENVYQRRADLIPNLVATVKGAKDFEQETLTQVVEARAKVGQVNFDQAPDAAQLREFESAQSGLSSALSRLLGRRRAIPGAQSDRSVSRLAGAARGDREPNHRRAQALQRRNARVQQDATHVPNRPARGLLGFGDKPYFESTEGRGPASPKVEF